MLDDYVPADDMVRIIDPFVGALDIAGLGFRRAVPQETGRPRWRDCTSHDPPRALSRTFGFDDLAFFDLRATLAEASGCGSAGAATAPV